jgi:hypothetical protein
MRGFALPTHEIGEVFGDWTVVDPHGTPDSSGARRSVCLCKCGSVHPVAIRDLRRGTSTRCRSCGDHSCTQRGVVKHGAMRGNRATAEYGAWKSMRDRCTNPRTSSYPRYGGRGITMALEWRGPGGFERFFAHVGTRPSKSHSIDRIDSNGHYEPGNVRWATAQEQARNKSNNRLITIGGRTQCLKDWAAEVGLRYDTVHARLKRGWSIDKALGLAAV